jgi:ABC-2 type transport system ATP-binding protein
VVKVFGREPWNAGGDWRARVAWVSDLPALHHRLTVAENLRFYAGLYGMGRGRWTEVLRSTGLEDLAQRPTAQLSRGQQQRLAWARALLVGAELLLLDEPTNGLDIVSKTAIHGLIQAHRAEGHTILLATHDMSEAERLADRVGILEQGALLDEDSPANLCRRHLGQSPGDPQQQPSLERVYRVLTGRNLYAAAEIRPACHPADSSSS